MYIQLEHKIYVEAALESQVHHAAHISREAVFYRKDGGVGLTGLTGPVGAFEIGIRHYVGLGEDALGGDVGKGSGDAAIGYFHPVHQAALICFGQLHQVAQEQYIVFLYRRVRDVAGVAGYDPFFLRGVEYGQAVAFLVVEHLACEAHSPLEEGCYFFIDFRYALPGFFQFVHRVL